MIKPKKSTLWNQLGLRNHIKQAFEDKESTWGQIVDSNKKNGNLSQRSISEYTLTQKLKEQHNSFIKNKERVPKTFLEDGICDQDEWSNLAKINEKSQLSPISKRGSNDQTFSPINRIKEQQQQQQSIITYQTEIINPQSQNICKLPGHENNQFKFICTDNECPYRLQKACAHCVIKMHTKHIQSMKEIENYELLIEQNLKRAISLKELSQDILQQVQKPYDEYFQQIKEILNITINTIQQELLQQNKDKIQKLIGNEIESINNWNTKFEAYNLMNTFIPNDDLEEYQRTLTQAKHKIKLNLPIDELKKTVEQFITSIFSDKTLRLEKSDKKTYESVDTLNRFIERENTKEGNESTRIANTSPQPKSIQTKLVRAQASPLNVFNCQITGRSIAKVIQTQPIVYYRN